MTSETDHFAPAVVVPIYNHARTVVEVLDRCRSLGLDIPIIVVNDGSTDATDAMLERWLNASGTTPTPAYVLRHERNRGKAAALRTGFAKAEQLNCTHAVTIDADLQHDPEDIPTLLDRAREASQALVIGRRRDDLAGTPRRSLIGRRLSNGVIRLASGVSVQDSQSGLRVYPLGLVRAVPCRSGRFSYETEIIVQAAWRGRRIIESPITSRYLPPGQRVSHFRPCVDSLRCLRLHARLLATSWGRRIGAPAPAPPSLAQHTPRGCPSDRV